MTGTHFSTLISIVSRLVSIHRTIARKHEAEIKPKLDSLDGLIAQSIMSIKLQENAWLSAKSLVAHEIRSLLAEDARCLIGLKDFQQFVRDELENELIMTVTEVGIGSDTANWSLLSLSSPLKLSHFQDCDWEKGYQYSIEINVDEWKQSFQVPVSAKEINEPSDENWDSYFQWKYIVKQLKETTYFSSFEQSQQEALKREISCIICYIAQMLHTVSIANSFTYP